ncbi:MAG: nicotinate (nicotinamide) nucleotide adenylyltransferase [Candidatus Enteromonas sp.]|nr:nicotinate (nicotinamide) nucleotide adenylyltransferase [Mollicutes bacterium]MDY4936053.1 nicotinate (nicotinamide) nucleotide adenylyltransferase [Candidatus Enteromonas sp.]
MDSLILYGGSFDPIHNGHLRIARAASLYFNSDVVFIPAPSPRWKSPSASSKDRLNMLRLALASDGSPSFDVSLFEMNSEAEVNYTIDTVTHFASRFPKRKLYLLIGADEANRFDKWKDASKIASMCQIIFVSRPGFIFNDEVLSRFNMRRLPFDESGEVSSSKIKSLQSLDIPYSVRNYIERHRLYYFKTLDEIESEHRLLHSISVANLACSIALKNKLPNHEKYYIAGLLHDIGKDIPINQSRLIMEKNYKKYLNYPEWTYHQFIAEYLIKEHFMIQDEEIIEAIKCHATGKKDMNSFDKIIYASDKIEPSRGYDSTKLIEDCMKSYEKGFLKVLKENKIYLESKGYETDNKLTKECYKEYLGE